MVDRLLPKTMVKGAAALPPDDCRPVRVKRVASLSETAVSDPPQAGDSSPREIGDL
jgi:hypothetical protein